MKTISLKNAKNALNRDELKSFFGGMGAVEEIVAPGGSGTCCASTSGGQSWCGLSKGSAQTVAADNGGRWCCDSCGSATWL